MILASSGVAPVAARGSSTPSTSSSHGERAGHDRDGEDRAHVAVKGVVQEDREQRSGEAADRVERLAESVGRASHGSGRDVRHQGVAGRAADALADAIDEARGQHLDRRDGDREDGLGQRAQAIAQDGEPACACGASR